MRNGLSAGALVAILTCLCGQAQACRMYSPLDLKDVKYADTVVVGRITSYRIVLDQKVREERRKDLASGRPMPPSYREMSEKQLAEKSGFLTDYAEFDVVVDEVLKGAPPKVFSVTWDNSTFGEPETMPAAKYLIAVRSPASAAPPLRGPSTTFFPNKKPWLPTLLQAPCSSAFVFEADGAEAKVVRRLIWSQPPGAKR